MFSNMYQEAAVALHTGRSMLISCMRVIAGNDYYHCIYNEVSDEVMALVLDGTCFASTVSAHSELLYQLQCEYGDKFIALDTRLGSVPIDILSIGVTNE